MLFDPRAQIGCHFQGTFRQPPNPGLNPGLFCAVASRQSPLCPFGTIPDSKLPDYVPGVAEGLGELKGTASGLGVVSGVVFISGVGVASGLGVVSEVVFVSGVGAV